MAMPVEHEISDLKDIMTTASQKAALICGSMAYDTIMVFEDRFKNHILADKIHMLNVSFLVPQMRREFGGCAGNIAFNLALLGDRGYPMASVGLDFGPYGEWMKKTGVPADYIRILDDQHTAQAFITSDLDDNQITAFHPGAMQYSHLNNISDATGIAVGIVAPDGRDGMLQHARGFKAAGIPFIFDLGQAMPLFNGDELRAFIDLATWAAFNDYEWQVVQDRTKLSATELASKLDALIVTKGAEGSVIYTKDRAISIPCAKARAVVDPTGCGDAYRAGLIHGLLHGLDWETTGRIASLLGTIKIESRGTQNHTFTPSQFEQRYEAAFGRPLTLKAS